MVYTNTAWWQYMGGNAYGNSGKLTSHFFEALTDAFKV